MQVRAELDGAVDYANALRLTTYYLLHKYARSVFDEMISKEVETISHQFYSNFSNTEGTVRDHSVVRTDCLQLLPHVLYFNTRCNMIDTTDIKEITDFSKARRNPYAEELRKNGYSIVINVSPEDISNMTQRNIEVIHDMDMLELDPDERRAFENYVSANNT